MFRMLFWLCAIVAVESHAASFDCTRTITTVEKLICSDKALTAFDDTLDDQYENSKRLSVENTHQVVAQQKAWLLDRNKCNEIACLRRSYELRIRELACAKNNMGSAIGAGACYYFELRESENILKPLQNQYVRQIVATSSNPKYTQELLASENSKWRESRDANCALFGETEGGSDGWRNVWTTSCALDETKKRIIELTRQIEKSR